MQEYGLKGLMYFQRCDKGRKWEIQIKKRRQNFLINTFPYPILAPAHIPKPLEILTLNKSVKLQFPKKVPTEVKSSLIQLAFGSTVYIA